MRPIFAAFVLALASATDALAYGGGGGSSGCEEPKFFEPKPAGPVGSFTEFRFVASDNTEPDTLAVDLNGTALKPQVERRRSGDYEVKAIPLAPVATAESLRIGVKARSRDGCWGFKPFTVEVKP